MSVFNILNIEAECSLCGAKNSVRLQFKYGFCWQFEYNLGDKVQDIGSKESAEIEGISETDCSGCNARQDRKIHFEGGKIMGVREIKSK